VLLAAHWFTNRARSCSTSPALRLDLFAQHELLMLMRKFAQSGIAWLVTHHLGDIIPENRACDPDERRTRSGGWAEGRDLTEERLSALFGLPVENGTTERILSPVVRSLMKAMGPESVRRSGARKASNGRSPAQSSAHPGDA